jgi:hypothetical protein
VIKGEQKGKGEHDLVEPQTVTSPSRFSHYGFLDFSSSIVIIFIDSSRKLDNPSLRRKPSSNYRRVRPSLSHSLPSFHPRHLHLPSASLTLPALSLCVLLSSRKICPYQDLLKVWKDRKARLPLPQDGRHEGETKGVRLHRVRIKGGEQTESFRHLGNCSLVGGARKEGRRNGKEANELTNSLPSPPVVPQDALKALTTLHEKPLRGRNLVVTYASQVRSPLETLLASSSSRSSSSPLLSFASSFLHIDPDRAYAIPSRWSSGTPD